MSTATVTNERQQLAIKAKQQLTRAFFKKGITLAIVSGMSYGLFSAFVSLAQSKGIWTEWYGEKTVLSAFVITYILGALGSGLNDGMSAIWSWIICGSKGKIQDTFRCINTKPGRVMMFAAIIGGPIAGTAYIIGMKLAGSLAIPITALCPAIGAILGKVIYKQELNKRMSLGVIICVFASVLIGTAGMTGSDENSNQMVLGLIMAFIAALCWGLEGVIAGYGTSIIDSEIAITIRQTTSGIANLFILVPLLSLMSGDTGIGFKLLGTALTDASSIVFFVISGFFALFAFSLWYKGNSMCGAALGMACNGAYSFWGPFFCWIVIGIIFGQSGWEVAPIVWVGAVIMIVGILLIAVNPMEFFGKKEGE